MGLQEHFKESMVLLKDLVFKGNLSIHNEKRINMTKSINIKNQIAHNLDRFLKIIEEKNRLDIELYDFAVKEIWERQAGRYGKKELARRVVEESLSPISSESGRMNRLFHEIYRNTAYKFMVFAEKLLGFRS